MFDGLSVADSIKLESVQRRAARVCTGAMRRTELKVMLSDLEWDTLESRRKKAKLNLFFNIKHALVPGYLSNLLPNDDFSIVPYNLRHSVNIRTPKLRLKCYAQSCIPSSIVLWNNLPPEIVMLTNKQAFKKHVNDYFLSTAMNAYCRKSFILRYCTGFYGRIMNQIRYGLSPLNFHLFTHNITDNPFCPKCHNDIENTTHFFSSIVSHTGIFGKCYLTKSSFY